ncbi:ABC transporter ATP-binding protein [Celeribacter baekdonensis]|uniref:ABC transporter ATP-binding protein n=1 Tax=Celeribacter baekdonensis TaxID=875171 RepID=UPI003A8CA7AF
MPEAVFHTETLVKTYHTGGADVRALSKVSLDLCASELTVLLDPSGSRKSTLLNILSGLDPTTSDCVLFRGLDLTPQTDHAPSRYRRDHVGFVFQFYNLVPSLNAREDVQMVTDIAPNSLSTDETLARVGMSRRMDHFPAELSGGQQQRVTIARANAKRPEVLWSSP